MSEPVGGERHERAVEAAVKECARLLQDDVDGNDAAKEAIDAYFASLAQQGIRLIEQPKCPECEGLATRGGGDPEDTADDCPRCGGSGVERMVPLAEVLEALREYTPEDLAGIHVVHPAAFIRLKFEGTLVDPEHGGGER